MSEIEYTPSQVEKSYIEKFKNKHNGKFDYSKVRFKTMGKDDFIKLGNNKFNNLYDYSKVHDFKDSDEPVIIICKEHGEFKQSPIIHLRSNGCPECTLDKKRLTLDIYMYMQESSITNFKIYYLS